MANVILLVTVSSIEYSTPKVIPQVFTWVEVLPHGMVGHSYFEFVHSGSKLPGLLVFARPRGLA